MRDKSTDSLLLTDELFLPPSPVAKLNMLVAHRLRTVIDCERLIILDKGKVAEFDTPLRLV